MAKYRREDTSFRRIKYKGRDYWYFTMRDDDGIAQEWVFTDKEMWEARKRAEKIHDLPLEEWQLWEVRGFE